MPNKALADDLVDDLLMTTVDLALARSPEQRDAYIREACGGDSKLIEQVRRYVEMEERMKGFLEDPLFPLPDEPPFAPGNLLAGRFNILGEVGEGGMGWVYEAWDKKLERRVAIKCAKSGFHKRLPPEVRHAREISHPNVCKIFDIHTVDAPVGEIDFISMEFLKGGTLAGKLHRGRMSQKEALAFALQISKGLAEAHRKGVVHGDVKSNNIIVTKGPDGAETAVITDFGLARRPGMAGARGTAQSMAGGAMDYMAPEIWKGGKATPASDVYGLGVILCELFAGRRPFGPDVPLEERFTGKPPAMHQKWDRVMARCLDPNPTRRFQNAGEVVEALYPPRPWWLVAAAAALLAIAVGVATNASLQWFAKEPLRLAMLPVEASSADVGSLADKLTSEVAGELAKIEGGPRFRLSFIPPQKARAARAATNILRVTISREDGRVLVHTALSDERSRSHLKDWTRAYDPGEERYIPVALAGMVTASLKLPPLALRPVNRAASTDYWDGLWYSRQNSTLDDALRVLGQAVDEDRDSPLTWAALGEAQWFEYRYNRDRIWVDRVRESMWQAENRDPDIAAAHRLEGYLHYADTSYTQAEPEFERAIALDSTNATAHIWLGKAYEDSSQYEKALKEFEKATDVDPNYFVTWQNLAAYYQQRSNFGKAATYLEKAVGLAPYEPLLRTYLAVLYRDSGRFPESEEQLRRDIVLKDTTAAEHGLGLTLMYEKHDLEAVQHFETALKLNSPQAGVRKYLVLMYLGIAQRKSQHMDEAQKANLEGLRLAEEEMHHSSRDGYVEAFVGYFSAAMGHRADAENYISSALGLFPDDSDTRWRAVLAYEELNRRSPDPALRKQSLEFLSQSTADQLEDVNRWPDLASLQADPDFKRLLNSHITR